MLLLVRFLLFALILFILYRMVKYVIDPKRKLELAHEQKRYFFLDDENNIRKNFLVTYKGVLFEGEKYLGTTDNAFEVVSIFVWPRNTASLKGLVREDFLFIERKILDHYQNAVVDWKSPIKEFMEKDRPF
ncbi:sigma-w pathway protein ysdB [Bacillus sp. T33-2]|uniref:sigma-w pathway protein ysdB n=1 Tax=Bacillus sp. T33-2 TaxID=2054168 RepID=UPI000C756827|nr:sigma-w pathway protein ysdB [Bacillus sp. T33-2]PLR98095.1 sigma-w pathway protein ysdB [Bacillus sp. T33-2]